MRKIPVANVTTTTHLYSKAVVALEEGDESANLTVKDRKGKVLASQLGVWIPAEDNSGGGTLTFDGGQWDVVKLKTCGCGGTKVTTL